MAKKDILTIFHFSVFLSNRKNAKMELSCGHFLFFDVSVFNRKRKNRKLTSSPLNFRFFYVWQKVEKSQLCLFFCYVVHILANWRDVMDLGKYTVLILNVHVNDLLKYLAINGRIRASSFEGLGMRQFSVGPSMAGIEKVVTVSYIKELVEKQAKTHREVSNILRQRYPGVEGQVWHL